MIDATSVRAVLFARDLDTVSNFYAEALGMECGSRDEYHAALQRSGFKLIVHQIPEYLASGIEISDPPTRRENGAVRLDFPVKSIERSRALAKAWGGGIDENPPLLADGGTSFYFGFDPEGNVFGVCQQKF